MKISDLKINGIKQPIGYFLENISVSWTIEDTKSQFADEKYVEVSKSADFAEIICKVSGKDVDQGCTILPVKLPCKASDNSCKNLFVEVEPRTRYYVRVYVKGNLGDEATGETFFETGKIKEAWKAEWIGTKVEDKFHPIFCKSFLAKEKIKSARLYICGLGAYEAYLNGERIGEEYLAPGLFDYTKEYQYQTHDVTDMVHVDNEICVSLGKGWYMGRFGLEGKECLYGDKMALISELHLLYESGKEEIICTDETWQYYGSDIEDSSIYDGEIYNHILWEKKENPKKKAVVLSMEKEEMLVERFGVPMKVKAELTVTEVIHTPAGETVLDFGQNMTGYVQFTADFAKGTRIVLDFGEILQEGNFYNENYRSAKSQFVYVSDGSKEVVWPHFTYFGFRYVRVTGWNEELNPKDFTAKAVYSDLDRTGYFECSNDKINRLYENSFWGQCSNFTDVPTDCPQRDERMAWTGDAQAFIPTACYHMDTRVFYRKFLHDLRNEQRKLNGGIPNYFPNQGNLGGCCAVWGDSGTFIPDALRKYYGNIGDYETEYEMMSDWVDYVTRECADENHLIKKQHQFGDWLALDGVTEQSMRGGTDEEYIAAMYYYASAKKTADMGKKIGASDWKKYELLAEIIKASILKEYFSDSGRLCVDTQTGYLVALRFGVYKDKEKVLEGLKKRLRLDAYKLKCGFVGAPVLCQTLAENELIEYAYEFLLKEDFPSWLYCVNLGATTIWERWNSVDVDGKISGTGMNSLNHYSYGNVAEFLYGSLAGVRSAGYGFKKAVIVPEITGRFSYVNASYNSVYGKYVCKWKIEEDGRLTVHVEVPFDCQAVLRLPEREEEVLKAGSYDISYTPVKDIRCIYGENSLLGELVKNPEAVQILESRVPQAIWLGNGDAEGRTIRMKELKEMFYMGVNPVSCQEAIEELEKVIVRA